MTEETVHVDAPTEVEFSALGYASPEAIPLEHHRQCVSAAQEKLRRRVIDRFARHAHSEALRSAQDAQRQVVVHQLWVHRATAAQREEREFYKYVQLIEEDRQLVLAVLPEHPDIGLPFRAVVKAVGGRLGRRQTRRALDSLVNRGDVLKLRIDRKTGLAIRKVVVDPPGGGARRWMWDEPPGVDPQAHYARTGGGE